MKNTPIGLSAVVLVALAQTPCFAQNGPMLLVGTDASGHAINSPSDWPSSAGPWNGKGAHYNAATGKLVFETYRQDIQGGSISARGSIRGVNSYYQAGPQTGSEAASGTTVLYVSKGDGSDPNCIGCLDVQDGRDGVRIFESLASASDAPARPVEKTGFTVYPNQNKDLASWSPDGKWLFAGVEMPRHALRHDIGNSEVGMFNDLWAISADGKTWVQLTDFARSWQYADSSVYMPFPSEDASHCPAGAQYAHVPPSRGLAALFKKNQRAPFSAYACSGHGEPPPSFGTMRPTVGFAKSEGIPIAWGERVGLDPKYTWAGPLQLAMAELHFIGGLPSLTHYRRNVTPTPLDPRGMNLWSNPNGDTQIGCGYEPWAFSRDNSLLGFASDTFLSTSSPDVHPTEMPSSEAFTDVIAWQWRAEPRLWDVTAHSTLYAYENNDAPGQAKYYGHWEEPMVFSLGAGQSFIAFGSSANLTPPWNPLRHKATFGLETWIMPMDGRRPAVKVTHFNDNGERNLAYPTSTDPADNSLYLTVAPGGVPGGNPPGAIYKFAASSF